MSFISFLDGTVGAAGSASSTSQLVSTFVPFVLIIAIFYFFLIRPQNKKQKETEKMINALKKGDKIVTIGGIHGVVSSTKEKTVIVKVDDNCKIEFSRSAIAGVESDKPAETKKASEAETTEENK
ncbi:MAG: preprotein translocase subunit YajC [Spirochaetia bacterium]|nr:preprotein translocase subunit YajC [Treponema sp.]MBR0546290.1 preprotein translocase subunit YajC [Treponema sp.]MCI6316318.1 preprotein translocase subunit YajC [Spirochaetia bacterium]